MEIFRKRRRFSEFVFGFISLGIGQELMRIGLLKPWSENIPFLLGIGIVGLFLSGVALFIIGRLALWFIKQYNQDNRVVKTLILTFTVAILGGLLIGGLGQFIYDHSSFSYRDVKNGVWLVTSVFQALVKVTVLFILYRFYQGTSLSWKEENFQRILVIVSIVLIFTTSIGLILPSISGLLLRAVDTVIVLGTVYRLIGK
ncbi:hypothetical protein [Streptococcus ruminantium]|uniref:hypothetical protein n=1 Tax=Streptococcus ruminantium TaxID=1917441 RepID=UPI0012DC0B39|nr:hypothetical protein [Streptococcus ruminantium]